MRKISNSEVTTWLTCRKQYKYAFRLNLTPKELNQAMTAGTLGHEAFQRYAEARLEGHSHEKALLAGEAVYINALTLLPIPLVQKRKAIWDRYMIHHNGWPEWKILGTEELVELPISDDIILPIRYDIKVQHIASGKNYVGDFKFTYDFWSPDDHSLNAQLPKYIFVLNLNGHEIHGGFLEEIRSRPLGAEKSSDPKNLFRRTIYSPSMAKKTSTIKQHIAASLEIEAYRNATPEEQDTLEIPALNKFGACKYCDFKNLCQSELDGNKDLTYFIESAYEQNTYGYNKENELGDLV